MEKEPRKLGQYHKLLLGLGVVVQYGCDILFVSGLNLSLILYLLGSPYVTLVLAISASAFLLRMLISAFSWKKMRFLPLNTEYRVTVLEMEIEELKSRINKLNNSGASHA